MKELIKTLTETFGPSGDEGEVRAAIQKEVERYASNVVTDALGNLLVTAGAGRGKKILLAAHMDEIGVMVTHVDEKGFVRLARVGGFHPYEVIGQRYRFKNGVTGIVGREKFDEQKDLRKLEFKSLYLDLGASSAAEALKLVQPGDLAVFDRPALVSGNRIIAKALDDRIGCVVLIETLKALKNPPNEVTFAFTVQEEVGTRGARTAAYRIDADFGIAVDVTDTGDVPEPDHPMAVSLGNGPAVKMMDLNVIAHPLVKDRLIQTAKEKKLPYQREILTVGGTDAGAIHLTREGVPSGALSIPSRYIHSPNEMVDYQDVENCVKLLVSVLERPW